MKSFSVRKYLFEVSNKDRTSFEDIILETLSPTIPFLKKMLIIFHNSRNVKSTWIFWLKFWQVVVTKINICLGTFWKAKTLMWTVDFTPLIFVAILHNLICNFIQKWPKRRQHSRDFPKWQNCWLFGGLKHNVFVATSSTLLNKHSLSGV